MKNFKLIISSIILVASQSCSTEFNGSSSEESKTSFSESNKIETVNFTYKGQTYAIKYEKVQNKENNEIFKPVQDESYEFLNRLKIENESLITYVIDDDNYILFENDKALSEYVNKNYPKLYNKSAYSKINYSNAYSSPSSIILYKDINWNTPFYWALPNDGFCIFFSNGGATDYGEGNLNRLKNFSDSSLWTIVSSGITTCPSNAIVGNRPNDQLTSLKVTNCLARLYLDINYGGESLVFDARGGLTRTISNLGYYKYGFFRKSWNDKVSSISLLD